VQQGESVVEGQGKTCAKAQEQANSFSVVKFVGCTKANYANLTINGTFTCWNNVLKGHGWHLKNFGKKDPNYKVNREAFAVAFVDACVVRVSPTQSPTSTRGPPATPSASGGGA
jgi:hypothetical protein